eukprot:tig00001024_g6328.t1
MTPAPTSTSTRAPVYVLGKADWGDAAAGEGASIRIDLADAPEKPRPRAAAPRGPPPLNTSRAFRPPAPRSAATFRSPSEARVSPAPPSTEREGEGAGAGGAAPRVSVPVLAAGPLAALALFLGPAAACVAAALSDPALAPAAAERARALLAAALALMACGAAACAAAAATLSRGAARGAWSGCGRRGGRREEGPAGEGRGGGRWLALRDELREARGECEAAAAALLAWRRHFEATFSLQAGPLRPTPLPAPPPEADQGHAYLCVDASGTVTRMNAAARRMFGVGAGAEAPRDLSELVPKLNTGVFLAELRRGSGGSVASSPSLPSLASAGGGGGGPPGRAAAAAGAPSSTTPFLAELRLCAYDPDPAGLEQTLCLQVRDVSWKEGRSMNAFMEGSNDAVIVMNARSTITAFNRRAEEMFGWQAAEAVGAKIEILMSRLYASMHHRAVKQFLAGGEPRVVGRLRETQAVRKSGQSFPIELSVSQTSVAGERLFIGSIREITARRKALHELEESKGRFENLLLNILPAPVAKELLEERPVISLARRFEDVVVLFADIAGFTTISERLDPRALVLTLNEIFSKFDALCEKHGLEKIKTIGDAYMAVSGLPFPFPSHLEAAADMALEMLQAPPRPRPRPAPGPPLTPRSGIPRGAQALETIPPLLVRVPGRRAPGTPGGEGEGEAGPEATPRRRRTSVRHRDLEDAVEAVLAAGAGPGPGAGEDWEEEEVALRIRVGMHVGPVVAGVVGFKKLSYDVWSDTVNTASRMESAGVTGRVHVSAALAARLRPAFDLEPRGTIQVKGKGAMETFLLVARKPAPAPVRSRHGSFGAPAGSGSPRSLAAPAGAHADGRGSPASAAAAAGVGGEARSQMSVPGATAAAARSPPRRRQRARELTRGLQIRMQEDTLARADMGDTGAGRGAGAGEFIWERVGEAGFNAREMVLLSAPEAALLVEKLLRMLGVASLGVEYRTRARGFHHALQAAHQLAVLVRGVPRLRRHVYPAEVLGLFLALLCQNAEGAVRTLLAAFRVAEEERGRPAPRPPVGPRPAAPPPAPASLRAPAPQTPRRGPAAAVALAQSPGAEVPAASGGDLAAGEGGGGMEAAKAWLTQRSFKARNVKSASEGASEEDGGRTSRPTTYRARGIHFPSRPATGEVEGAGPGRAGGQPRLSLVASALTDLRPVRPAPLPRPAFRPARAAHSSPRRRRRAAQGEARLEGAAGAGAGQGAGGAEERVAALLAEYDDACATALGACLEAAGDAAPRPSAPPSGQSFVLGMDGALGEYEALRCGDVGRAWSLSPAARRRLCVFLFRFCSLVDVYKIPSAAERCGPSTCYRFFPEMRGAETADWMEAEGENIASDGASSANSFFSLRSRGGLTPIPHMPLFGSLGAALGPSTAPTARPGPPAALPRAPSLATRAEQPAASAPAGEGAEQQGSNPLAPAWGPGVAARQAAVARGRQEGRLPEHLAGAWRGAAEHVLAFLEIVAGPVLLLAGRLLPELGDEEAKLEPVRDLWRCIAWGPPPPPPPPPPPSPPSSSSPHRAPRPSPRPPRRAAPASLSRDRLIARPFDCTG